MEVVSAVTGSIFLIYSSINSPGDTLWTVTYKKIVANVSYLLNPDTYSNETLIQLKDDLLKHKVDVVSGLLVVGVPVAIIFPLLRPKLLKIKRDFLFQYYLQSQTLARKLQTNSNKLPLWEM